jgi:hypothetical protein
VYMLRQRALPALGKEAEVRAQLTDWGKHLQTQGRSVAVSAQVFSSDGPALVVATRADDLNTLERYRHENLGDSDWQARAARVVALLRAPVSALVHETLMPVSGSGPAGVIQRAVGFPALGKDDQYVSLAEQFVKDTQAAGVRAGMSRRIFSSIGAVIELVSAYADVAALDQARRERQSAIREFVQRAHEVSREPTRLRVFEVLLPFQT